jgi:protein-L-isoaspartate(D-aspartate) O-methyltransferase
MATATEPNTLNDPARIEALRMAMVEDLREIGAVVSDLVADAFKAVPRHLFAPEETLERAYGATVAPLAKRDANGVATSWVSAPSVQAQMLEQAEVQPGMRVLEVGSGGYNAALLAEIVGEFGRVTTVDIDPDIVARASSFLSAAGYQSRVRVREADAEFGVPDAAPYDRIIVTAGAWDIPPAWIDQLAEGGRLIAPLRIRGLTRSITFERDHDYLVSRNYRLSAFVPMQGVGEHDKRLITVDAVGVGLWVDEEHQFVDAEALKAALHSKPVTVWPGVGFDLPDEVEFYVGTNAAAVGILHASKDVVASGLLAPSVMRGTPAVLSADSASFAYRTKKQSDGPNEFEFGVIGHGPQAEFLAGQLAQMLRDWSKDFRRRDAADIRIYPRSTPDAELPAGCVVDKRHARVVVSWPKPRIP